MTVYIVATYGYIKAVYATREAAEKAAKEATRNAEMGGSNSTYYVEEKEVKE